MPLWTHLYPKDDSNDQHESTYTYADEKKYAKVACLAVIHVVVMFVVPRPWRTRLENNYLKEMADIAPIQLPLVVFTLTLIYSTQYTIFYSKSYGIGINLFCARFLGSVDVASSYGTYYLRSEFCNLA